MPRRQPKMSSRLPEPMEPRLRLASAFCSAALSLSEVDVAVNTLRAQDMVSVEAGSPACAGCQHRAAAAGDSS